MPATLSHPDYPAFLAALKERILNARISAARAINHELVLLYWDIGRGIVEKQQTAGWGDAVVERLAADLRAGFPDVRGFSAFNLWRMRQLYLEYSSPEFLARAVPELTNRRRKFLAQAVPEITLPAATTQAAAILEPTVPELIGSHATAQNAEIPAQVAREFLAVVPWGHHVEMLKKIKAPAARLYYLRATAQFGWS
jgi:hypothetical protein